MDCNLPGTSVHRCSLNSCSYHFMMNVNQIIMLYVLNLHSDVFQLYLNKIGRLKKRGKVEGELGEGSHLTSFASILLCINRDFVEGLHASLRSKFRGI